MTDFNDLQDPEQTRNIVTEALHPKAKKLPPKPFNWRSSGISAADLKAKQFPEVKWVIPPFLPEGVALLGGKPKLGKSWLDLDWAIAVASGGPIFGGYKGIKVKQGDSLYLALEDNQRRLQGRIDKLGLEWPARLRLHTEWPLAHQGGVEALFDWCKSVPDPRLIIIDTFAKFRPPIKAKGNGYEQDYDAITPLKALTNEHGVAILITTHLRKAESEDPFDSISGTLGLTGAADTLLILQRRASGIVFCVRGREVYDEELAAKFDPDTCRWTIIGKADEVDRSKKSKAILAALEDAASHAKTDAEAALSVKEIRIASGLGDRGLEVQLHRMLKKGEIERAERGKYRYPHVRNVINDAWMD